mmetsp:Transcript_28861/g.76133  ORF Transcript_28861/g.76133 Transcript_28861/m.76133 type:complete len:88 (+) Transcript_28861:467-730(+)
MAVQGATLSVALLHRGGNGAMAQATGSTIVIRVSVAWNILIIIVECSADALLVRVLVATWVTSKLYLQWATLEERSRPFFSVEVSAR